MSPSPDLIVPSGGDWVDQRMDYRDFRNAGHSFAMRYAVPSITGKMITRAEISSAHANGVDVGLVYEVNGTSWEGGHVNGTLDGEAARNALESLGAPHTVACYHAVDSQVSEGQINTCMTWLAAVRDAMRPFRTGVYGQYSVIQAAFAMDPSIYRWQTQAWSGGQVSRDTEILQLGTASIAGIGIDLDIAYVSAFGQWYANPGNQPQPPSEDSMISGVINGMEVFGVPIPANSPTYIMLFCDTGLFAGAAQQVRVAIRSKAKGYSQIVTAALHAADSVTIPFEEHDVDAVSLARNAEDGVAPVGYTIA